MVVVDGNEGDNNRRQKTRIETTSKKQQIQQTDVTAAVFPFWCRQERSTDTTVDDTGGGSTAVAW